MNKLVLKESAFKLVLIPAMILFPISFLVYTMIGEFIGIGSFVFSVVWTIWYFKKKIDSPKTILELTDSAVIHDYGEFSLESIQHFQFGTIRYGRSLPTHEIRFKLLDNDRQHYIVLNNISVNIRKTKMVIRQYLRKHRISEKEQVEYYSFFGFKTGRIYD